MELFESLTSNLLIAMPKNPNIIPGTIVIGDPALVVDLPEVNVIEVKANAMAQQTNRPFTYGNPNDPTSAGEPVNLIQGEYAFVLVGMAKKPISPEDFFRLSAVIAQELTDITGVGTVRQDLIPVIAEDWATAYVGNLQVIAYPLPPEPEPEPEPDPELEGGGEGGGDKELDPEDPEGEGKDREGGGDKEPDPNQVEPHNPDSDLDP